MWGSKVFVKTRVQLHEQNLCEITVAVSYHGNQVSRL